MIVLLLRDIPNIFKQIIQAGDGVYIEPNLMHSAICLEEGMLIDVFSPIREDFMDGSAVSYFGGKDEL